MEIEEHKPTPIRDLWTACVFHVLALFKGALGGCGRCGRLSEVYCYGDGILRHRAAGREYGHTSAPRTGRGFLLQTQEQWLFWFEKRVCFACAIALDDVLQVHEGCWCREAARECAMKNGLVPE